MISEKVKKVFTRMFPPSQPKPEEKKKVHPYLLRRQSAKSLVDTTKAINPSHPTKPSTPDPTPRPTTTTKPTKWKTRQPVVEKHRIQSNVHELVKRAIKNKERTVSQLMVSQPLRPETTRITPVRPNGTIDLPTAEQTPAPLMVDTASTPMVDLETLVDQVDALPRRRQTGQERYRNTYELNEDDTTSRIVYGIHDCIYQSILRMFIWYRGTHSLTESIKTPTMRKNIDMVNERIPWKTWIAAQQALHDRVTYTENNRTFTPNSFPSWNKWRACVRRIENTRQALNPETTLTTKETPTIQTMCQWLFDSFAMGCIVIPKMHIFTCLLIDSTCLLEWPFLFGVSDNHVYPIMNSSCNTDWIHHPSVLEGHYRRRKCKNHTFPTLECSNSIQEKVLGMTKRKYDFLIDKHTRRQYTLMTIQNELKKQDFLLVPFWTGEMMDTLRRAMYRMMRHTYAQKSSVFSKTWASQLETIFSFYEREYTMMSLQ